MINEWGCSYFISETIKKYNFKNTYNHNHNHNHKHNHNHNSDHKLLFKDYYNVNKFNLFKQNITNLNFHKSQLYKNIKFYIPHDKVHETQKNEIIEELE